MISEEFNKVEGTNDVDAIWGRGIESSVDLDTGGFGNGSSNILALIKTERKN